MKITFRESGGFTGLVRGCELDGALLEPGAKAIVDGLSGETSLPRGDRKTGNPEGEADVLFYELIIEDEGRKRHLAFSELSIPPGAEGLIDFLRGQAEARKA